jgi:chorismate mutase/prephenate dehydratase
MGKRTVKPPTAATESGPSAAQLRRSLQRTDRQLVQLMNQRAKLVQQLANAADGKPEIDLAGSIDSVQQLVALSEGPLADDCLRTIFRELVSGTRALVRPLRVAYLGPQYSYSHLATTQRFGQSVEAVPVATIAAVFDEVLGQQSDFGLVPIENSTDGRIVDTLGRFARVSVQICGEVQLRIHHCLLGIGPRAGVKEVHSKPQALSQCRDWLATHLPQAQLVEAASTAMAAQLASENPQVAAIASIQAARQHGLEVIAKNIEDNPNNITRFAVIGNQELPRTRHDKTSLMFEIPHRPGALAEVMAIFKRCRLNLTWIESFPMPDTRSEYLFFVELEGHKHERPVRRALEALANKTVRLVVLGSYPRSDLED